MGQHSVSRNSRSPYKIDAHFLEAHQLPEPMLYKTLAPKIGLLTADLVIAITEFYGNLQLVKSSLPLLIENKERGYSYSVSMVLIPARDAVKNIIPALRKIEQMTSITTSAKNPDLGKAEEFIEFEQMRFEANS